MVRPTIRVLLNALSISLLFPLPGATDVYKSVDAQGRVSYGDRPPTGRTWSTERIAVVECHEAKCRARQRKAQREVQALYRRTVGKRPGRDAERLQILANDGRVAPGMSARQVHQAWGPAAKTERRHSGSGRTEVWTYERAGHKATVAFGADGRVKSIRR